MYTNIYWHTIYILSYAFTFSNSLLFNVHKLNSRLCTTNTTHIQLVYYLHCYINEYYSACFFPQHALIYEICCEGTGSQIPFSGSIVCCMILYTYRQYLLSYSNIR